MKRPGVLVLLAAYNGAKWIREQVESILAQRDVDVELVISDDGSTDGTRSLLEGLALDARVTLNSSPTPSGSAAQNFLWLIRNTAAGQCGFIAFADQDDVWDLGKLARACAALNAGEAGGYSCAVTARWGSGREVTLSQADRATESDFLFEGAGQGCTYVLTAAFFQRLRAFFLQNPSLTQNLHFHDWAIYALSRTWRIPWAFDPASMVKYRQHGENDTGARVSVAGIGRRLRLIRAGWYGQQIAGIAQMCRAASPADPVIEQFRGLLAEPAGLARRFRLARFCLRGGRRRRSDRTALLIAVVCGWI
jgi:rhamnosyltransferase